MFIESKLRTRLILTLDWLTDKLCEAGYIGPLNPEAMEAKKLLEELQMSRPAPTEPECRDMAAMMGLSEAWGSGYYRTYASQGWCKSNGVSITDVRLHMQKLRAEGVEYGDLPANAPVQSSSEPTLRQQHIKEIGR